MRRVTPLAVGQAPPVADCKSATEAPGRRPKRQDPSHATGERAAVEKSSSGQAIPARFPLEYRRGPCLYSEKPAGGCPPASSYRSGSVLFPGVRRERKSGGLIARARRGRDRRRGICRPDRLRTRLSDVQLRSLAGLRRKLRCLPAQRILSLCQPRRRSEQDRVEDHRTPPASAPGSPGTRLAVGTRRHPRPRRPRPRDLGAALTSLASAPA